MRPFTVGSLFAGIGGFDLAAERAGMVVKWQCEIDDFCNKVLAKHWPNVARWDDIRTLDKNKVDILANITYNSTKVIKELNSMSRKLDPKYNEVVNLYNSGMSIEDVADYFMVTRQAMHGILKVRGAKFRSKKRNGEDNHFYRGGKTASKRAQDLAWKAIKKGVLIPEPCEVCKDFGKMKDGRNKIQAHHNDYTKPLEVRWLCQRCHHEWHKENKPITGEDNAELADGSSIDVLVGGFP